jgi:hypothetical protein
MPPRLPSGAIDDSLAQNTATPHLNTADANAMSQTSNGGVKRQREDEDDLEDDEEEEGGKKERMLPISNFGVEY